MENSIDKADPLEVLHRMFFDAEEAADDERQEAEKARDYFDGKQYTSEEMDILTQRKQPPITLNRVARKVNHLLGVEMDRRTDPKAFPRTEKHAKGAEAITDALRYVEQNIKLDQKFSKLHSNMLIEGYGAVEFTVKRKGETDEIEIDAICWEWDRLFYDPMSVLPDFSDASYLGGVEWMDYDKAKLRFPGKEALLTESNNVPSGGSSADDYDDKPDKKAWITRGNRKRIRIVQMYYMSKGEWWLAQFTGGGVLKNIKVPFVDEEGNNYCPMKFRAANVDRDGDKYGEVRNLFSPQDMINKTHSKLQHLISVRQIIAEDGAILEEHGGIDHARQELAKPDGVIIKDKGADFEVVQTADMASGHASLLQEFKSEIDLMGPNASMQGKGPSSQSGRALMAQTEGGLREFNPIADRFAELKEECYQIIWFLIKQYWTYEKWVRVTDDEEKLRFTGLNIPRTRLDLAEERMREQGAQDQDIEALKAQVAQNPLFAAQANQIAEVQNDVAQMDVDIIIESGPDMVTMQGEQFQALASLAPALAASGTPIPPKALIMASQLRDKDKIMEMLEGKDKEPSPEEQQAAQKAQQLQEQKIMLELAKDKAEVQKTQADAVKTEAEAIKVQSEIGQTAPVQDDSAKIGLEQARFNLDRDVKAEQLALERDKLESSSNLKIQELAQIREIELRKLAKDHNESQTV